MSQDLHRAKQLLTEQHATVVLCKNNITYHSSHRGIQPLLDWLDSQTDLMGFSAADKVVGRGAAFVYRLLGVRAVHGRVMSIAAVKILRAGGIEASWDLLTESIQNRQKNGPCPIELATGNIQEPENALFIIRSTLEELRK